MESVDENEVMITSIVGLTLVVLGLGLNIICAYASRLHELKSNSTAIILCGAVLSDIMVLIFGSLKYVDNLSDEVTEAELLHGGDTWRCRFSMFFEGLCKMVSSWLMVAMVAEATLGTYYTWGKSKIYSSTRASYITGYVYLLAFVATILYAIIINAENGYCSSVYPEFYEIYKYGVLHLVVSQIMPMIFIVICYVIIFVVQEQRKRAKTHRDRGDDREEDETTMRWRQQFVGVSLTCGAIFITFTLPLLVYDSIATLERFMLLTPPSWWSDIRSHDQLVSTIATLLYLLPFSIKFLVAFMLEQGFRTSINQLCTYDNETLSAKQRRAAVEGGNMHGPIQYSKGKGFLKGFKRFY